MDDLRKQKIDNALTFYMQAIKLKNVIRSGWKRWDIDSKRVESIAEHIYGTMMLAIAIHSELDEYKDVNLDKVLKILAIHEMEEIRIGDITPFDNVTDEEKRNLGKVAVKELCDNISEGNDYIELIEEFENQITKEAKFSRMIDKLEADMQAKIYDENNAFDLTKESVKEILDDERIKKMTANGVNTVSGYFIHHDLNKYDDNLKEVALYTLETSLTEHGKIEK